VLRTRRPPRGKSIGRNPPTKGGKSERKRCKRKGVIYVAENWWLQQQTYGRRRAPFVRSHGKMWKGK